MDSWPLFILFAAAIVALIVWRGSEGQGSDNAEWSKAGDELSIGFNPGGVFGTCTLIGDVDGCLVRAERYKSGDHLGTRVVVKSQRMDPQLEVHRETEWNKLTNLLGVKDIEIGDPAFDGALHVRGNVANAVAVFNFETRSFLLRNLTSEMEVSLGQVSFEALDSTTEARSITDIIRLMVSLARRLSPSDSVPEALARNVEKDPEATVRRKSLEILLQQHPEATITSDVTRKALDDADPEIRLLAATRDKGMYGYTILERLVAEDGDDGIRARALTELSRAYGTGVALATRKALGSTGVALRRAAIRAVAHAHDVEALEALCAIPADDPCALDCAGALEALADGRAEPALLELLANGKAEVQVAAARALGVCGTVKAVEPLLARGKGLLGSDFKQTARDAVRAIQSRLGDAEAGRLALAEPAPEEGALSLPVGEGIKSR
jgi:hypothetical protein